MRTEPPGAQRTGVAGAGIAGAEARQDDKTGAMPGVGSSRAHRRA